VVKVTKRREGRPRSIETKGRDTMNMKGFEQTPNDKEALVDYSLYQEVTLNDMEWTMAKIIGAHRHCENRFGRGRYNQHYWDDKPGHDTVENCCWLDSIGMGGELAFCKMVGKYPDFRIQRGSLPSWNEDTWLNDCSVDIKSRLYPGLTTLSIGDWKKNKPCDVYVLMKPQIPYVAPPVSVFDYEEEKDVWLPDMTYRCPYYFIGWIHGKHLFKDKNRRRRKDSDGKHYFIYQVPVDKLHKDWRTISNKTTLLSFDDEKVEEEGECTA